MHLGIIKITYNRSAQPRCYHNVFNRLSFHDPRRGCNSDFAMTIWRFWISDRMHVVFAIDCSNAEFCTHVCVCVCMRTRDRVTVELAILNRGLCVRERESHSPSEIVLIVACLQTHTSIITVSVTWLCTPLGLELMVKLRTLLNVITVILKIKERGVTFPTWLVVFSQTQCTVSAGQSEQTTLFERGGA